MLPGTGEREGGLAYRVNTVNPDSLCPGGSVPPRPTLLRARRMVLGAILGGQEDADPSVLVGRACKLVDPWPRVVQRPRLVRRRRPWQDGVLRWHPKGLRPAGRRLQHRAAQLQRCGRRHGQCSRWQCCRCRRQVNIGDIVRAHDLSGDGVEQRERGCVAVGTVLGRLRSHGREGERTWAITAAMGSASAGTAIGAKTTGSDLLHGQAAPLVSDCIVFAAVSRLGRANVRTVREARGRGGRGRRAR